MIHIRTALKWMWTLMLVSSLHGQGASAHTDRTIRVAIAKKERRATRVMADQHIFRRGDMLRLRVVLPADGYLYVVNRGSSGKVTVLFPEPGENATRIQSGREYVIPQSPDRWLLIEGPPGVEQVYVLLSDDKEVPRTTIFSPPGPETPSSLLPRCDDDLFRSRGECIGSDTVGETDGDDVTLTGSHPDGTKAIRIQMPNTSLAYKIQIAHR